MKTFTYKTEKPTGPFRSFQGVTHYIKLKSEVIGIISDEDYSIRLMCMKHKLGITDIGNCKWKWIKLAYKSASLEKAKEFLNSQSDNIIQKYGLLELITH